MTRDLVKEDYKLVTLSRLPAEYVSLLVAYLGQKRQSVRLRLSAGHGQSGMQCTTTEYIHIEQMKPRSE
jgi:hypothetical protein